MQNEKKPSWWDKHITITDDVAPLQKQLDVKTTTKIRRGDFAEGLKNNKNTIIYLTVATLAFWGGLESISEMQAVPYNANAIVGAALALFEVWLFKFCLPDREFNLFALFLGGIPISIGLYGLSAGNPLTPGVLLFFVAGIWIYWWFSKDY